MSKTINARIAALESIIKAVASINKGIDKVQAAIGGGLDKVQGKATAALNTRLDKLVQERIRAAAAARNEPNRKFYQVHDQLAELRATFTEDSQRLLDEAKQHISSEAVAAAEAKAKALSDEAAALLARKK